MTHQCSKIASMLTLGATLVFSGAAQAQQIQRQLGDFDVTLGTTPSRSMAQGLISPSAAGAFHGGLDISHNTGWYLGQYAPSIGVTEDSTLKLESYAGYKHNAGGALGYEIGFIQYSQPNISGPESYALYGGISVLGSRIGGAWRDTPGKRTSTLLADFGQIPVMAVDLRIKLAHHRLGSPFTTVDGGQVSAYSDWSLEVSRPWLGIDLNLAYNNSSLSGDGCDAYSGINTYCQRVVTLKAERSLF